MKEYGLIYFIKDRNDFDNKLIKYIEMKVIKLEDIKSDKNKYLYEIGDIIKAKNLEEAKKYFKKLYKNSEEVRIS